jgi:hypothetical protein
MSGCPDDRHSNVTRMSLATQSANDTPPIASTIIEIRMLDMQWAAASRRRLIWSLGHVSGHGR